MRDSLGDRTRVPGFRVSHAVGNGSNQRPGPCTEGSGNTTDGGSSTCCQMLVAWAERTSRTRIAYQTDNQCWRLERYDCTLYEGWWCASPTDEEFEGENSNFEVYPVLNRKLVDLLRLYSSSLDDINYPLIVRTVLTTETSLPLSLTQYRYRRYFRYRNIAIGDTFRR
jgi:hypothetical protein